VILDIDPPLPYNNNNKLTDFSTRALAIYTTQKKLRAKV